MKTQLEKAELIRDLVRDYHSKYRAYIKPKYYSICDDFWKATERATVNKNKAAYDAYSKMFMTIVQLSTKESINE